MQVEDHYAMAAELCEADIPALPPEKIAAAIRARKTVLYAISGSGQVMSMVYDRAA